MAQMQTSLVRNGQTDQKVIFSFCLHLNFLVICNENLNIHTRLLHNGHFSINLQHVGGPGNTNYSTFVLQMVVSGGYLHCQGELAKLNTVGMAWSVYTPNPT